MIETSTMEESYSYKIPCEIAISDDYDTFDATVDIDDFHYEIIDDEILRVKIVVAIDNLKKKEVDEPIQEVKTDDLDIELLEDDRCYDEDEEKPVEKTSFLEVKESIKKQNDTYLTYKVYIFKDGDSIDSILEKYKISKDELLDYNQLEDITVGSKIVIPSSND